MGATGGKVMKVYVASSWRNNYQPGIVRGLREMGHEVYDFRNPREGNRGFAWSDIDPGWQRWTPEQYLQALDDPLAQIGFDCDMTALRWCDAVVAVQPFGRNASLELGWAAGEGKFTLLLLANGEPELMVKMCDHICLGFDDVVLRLQDYEDAQGG